MVSFLFKDANMHSMLFGMFEQSGKHYMIKSMFPVV